MKKEQLVGFEIRTLSVLIKRNAEQLPIKRDVDRVTGMHGWVIGYLYDHQNEQIFQRDLEQKFSIRRSTATAILQLMEKNELIVREPVPQDKRLKKLILTPKAVELHHTIVQEIDGFEAKMTEGISPEEMKGFFATIDKLKKNLEQTDPAQENGERKSPHL